MALKLALSFKFVFFFPFAIFIYLDNISEMLYILYDNKTTPFYLTLLGFCI